MNLIFQDKFKSFLIVSLLALLGFFTAWAYSTFLHKNHLREIVVPKVFQFSYETETNNRWAEYVKNPLPPILHNGDKNSNKIALTFDDGPDTKNFNNLLNILKQKNVKATFFLVGSQIKKHPKQVIRANKEGHQLGNHTLSHDRITGLSEHQIIEEVESVRTQIYKLTGKLTYLFRPPGGQLDKTSLQLLENLKYTTVLWTHNAGDWNGDSSKDIYKRVVTAKGGAIILMHGINQETITAIPQIIKDLQAKGYKFVTIDDIIPDNQYARN